MKPHSAATLVLAALLLLPISPLAADSPGGDKNPSPGSGPNIGSDTSDAIGSVNPFLPGEQTIGLAAGLQIPAFLLPSEGGGIGNLKLGGSFSFSYQYFIARGLGIGGISREPSTPPSAAFGSSPRRSALPPPIGGPSFPSSSPSSARREVTSCATITTA